MHFDSHEGMIMLASLINIILKFRKKNQTGTAELFFCLSLWIGVLRYTYNALSNSAVTSVQLANIGKFTKAWRKKISLVDFVTTVY